MQSTQITEETTQIIEEATQENIINLVLEKQKELAYFTMVVVTTAISLLYLFFSIHLYYIDDNFYTFYLSTSISILPITLFLVHKYRTHTLSPEVKDLYSELKPKYEKMREKMI